jgi:Fe-S oxidoreductase/nitrate reductase gamma subunit
MTPERLHYWNIEPVWFFYVLAGLAVAIFISGLIIHLSVWIRGLRHQNIPLFGRGFLDLFLEGLLGRRIFSGNISAGIMHLFIMWGFLGLFAGTVLISADYWLYHFLKGPFYLWYSICLEILGLMLMAGLVWAFIRRYLQRIARLERRIEDFIPVAWLFLAALSGFLVEGIRLAAQRPEWAEFSFVGYWVSLLWPHPDKALSIYPYFWWAHALLTLSFIAAIPFSKLFHILAAPASIYLEKQPAQVIPTEIRVQEGETFSFRDIIFLDACTRCGRCVEVCPSAGSGEPFAPRDFIIWTRNNLLMEYHPLNRFRWFANWINRRYNRKETFDPQKAWHCTTCRACLEVCPVYVSTAEVIQSARTVLVEDGTRVPSLLIQTLEKLYKYNNPWEASKTNRAKWSGDMEITDLTKGEAAGGFCYFVGCTTSFDIRAQDLARSFAKILMHAQVGFGTLGKKEPCCGDIARRVGEQGLFEEQMEDCLGLFDRFKIRDVVTSSPHCLHTFRNDYPAFQALKPSEEQIDFRVRHYSEVLNELVANGSIRFEKPLHAKITYHDPCYLGRYNRIFDAPRDVITAIPGVEMVEMAHNRANSLCCGGGGGRMWQEDLDAEVKMSEIRIREAEAAGAEMVITACPLCLIMLEDARKTAGLEDTLRIMDLNELVLLALGLSGKEG